MNKNKPIRLISLFSGYDSQLLALKYLGTNVESWRTCEWAVKSIQALKDLHFGNDNIDYSKDLAKEELIDFLVKKGISADYNKPMTEKQVQRLGETKLRIIYNNIKATYNMVNVQQVNGNDLGIEELDKYNYIMTYSYPCQDLSLAGKQKGMAEGSGTRSSMLWEVGRILEECYRGGYLPQILLMENVPQVYGKKNIEYFNLWLDKLKSLGYKNHWKGLNAKDYGVPQNRNRCFVVSLLDNRSYEFPKPIELKLKLKDLLEETVDEKYYLNNKQLDYILDVNNVALASGRDINQRIVNPNIAKTISCRGAADQRADVTNFVMNDNNKEYKVIDLKEKLNLITSLQKEVCNKALDFVKSTDVIDYTYSNSRLEEMGEGYIKTKNKDNNNIGCTLTTNSQNFGVCVKESKNFRIRKFVPKECFKLMGVCDKDFEKIAKNQSDSSLYHLAGDSIVTTCLGAIFGSLFGIDWIEKFSKLGIIKK